MKAEERIVQLLESIDRRMASMNNCMDVMVNRKEPVDKRMEISNNVTLLEENNRKLEQVLADPKASIARLEKQLP